MTVLEVVSHVFATVSGLLAVYWLWFVLACAVAVWLPKEERRFFVLTVAFVAALSVLQHRGVLG